MKRTPLKRGTSQMKRSGFGKVRKAMKKRSSLGTLRNKCDALMQEIGHKKYKKCLICSNPQQVMHHFVPKSVSSRLRYEWANLVPLCNGCHIRLHQSGDPHYEMSIVHKWGEAWYEDLRRMKGQIIKVNAGYFEEVYQKLLDELSKVN